MQASSLQEKCLTALSRTSPRRVVRHAGWLIAALGAESSLFRPVTPVRRFASAAAPKEPLQKGKALVGEQPFRNLDLMVKQFRVGQAKLAPDGPEAQITGREDEPRDTRRDQSSGAHRAGFERDIERRVRQPVVAKCSRRCPQCLDLGVRGRIAGCNRAVRSRADDLTLLDDDGAHRNFSGALRFMGFGEREPHETLVLSSERRGHPHQTSTGLFLQ